LRKKGPLQNGPVTKWAMPKRATPKWSCQKDVLSRSGYHINRNV